MRVVSQFAGQANGQPRWSPRAGKGTDMKLKMFIGPDAKDIERQVNIWRRESPQCEIIKSETTISYHIIQNQLQQRVSMAIWHSDGSAPEMPPVLSPAPPRQPGSSN
jgi:hypothetical protein